MKLLLILALVGLVYWLVIRLMNKAKDAGNAVETSTVDTPSEVPVAEEPTKLEVIVNPNTVETSATAPTTLKVAKPTKTRKPAVKKTTEATKTPRTRKTKKTDKPE